MSMETKELKITILEGNGIQSISDYANGSPGLKEFAEFVGADGWYTSETRERVLEHATEMCPVEASDVAGIGHKMHLEIGTIVINESGEIVDSEWRDADDIIEEANRMNEAYYGRA